MIVDFQVCIRKYWCGNIQVQILSHEKPFSLSPILENGVIFMRTFLHNVSIYTDFIISSMEVFLDCEHLVLKWRYWRLRLFSQKHSEARDLHWKIVVQIWVHYENYYFLPKHSSETGLKKRASKICSCGKGTGKFVWHHL